VIYLDTSCLLKLFLKDPESEAARDALDAESGVIISSLTELEADVQLRAAALGGKIRPSEYRHHQARLIALRNMEPFHFQQLSGDVFQTALQQHRRPQSVYLRPLDRMHLAAMECLRLSRLLTFDKMQAQAARTLAFSVIIPN